MSKDILGSFVDKKNAESPFLTIGDGESVKVFRLKDIKMVTKAGFDGKEKEVLRLVCEIETTEGLREKTFDNGTARFAKELQDKGVKVGSGFTISRTGLQTKTRYTVSEVTAPGATKE